MRESHIRCWEQPSRKPDRATRLRDVTRSLRNQEASVLEHKLTVLRQPSIPWVSKCKHHTKHQAYTDSTMANTLARTCYSLFKALQTLKCRLHRDILCIHVHTKLCPDKMQTVKKLACTAMKNRKNDKTAAQHTVCQRTRFVFSNQQASPGVNKFSKVQGSWD